MKALLWYPNTILQAYKSYPTEEVPTPEFFDLLYTGSWFNVIERRGTTPQTEWVKLERVDENGAAAPCWIPRMATNMQFKPKVSMPAILPIYRPWISFTEGIAYVAILTEEVSLYKSGDLTGAVIRKAHAGEHFLESAETPGSLKFAKFWYEDNAGVLNAGYVPTTYIPQQIMTFGQPYDSLILLDDDDGTRHTWADVPLNPGATPPPPPPPTGQGCLAWGISLVQKFLDWLKNL
jgi:hypothetical protein